MTGSHVLLCFLLRKVIITVYINVFANPPPPQSFKSEMIDRSYMKEINALVENLEKNSRGTSQHLKYLVYIEASRKTEAIKQSMS